MEQCSTQQLIRSTRAFDERVRYWKSRGLTPEEAEIRARKKNEMPSITTAPVSPFKRIINYPSKHRPINVYGLCLEQEKSSEPTQRQVQEVLTKLFESGQATLLNAHGEVIEPAEFKKGPPLQSAAGTRSEAEQLKSAVRLILPALQVIISSGLLMTATVKALGGLTLENLSIAILLETGVLSLFLTQSKSIWSKAAMRAGACALVILGFFVLHSQAHLDHNQWITKSVFGDDRVSSIKQTKVTLEESLKQLPATHRTARNELLAQIEKKQGELDSAQTVAVSGGQVSALEQIFLTWVVTRLALQLLNVFFAHSFIVQLRKEGFLT